MSKKKLVSVAVASLLALGGSLGLATGASAAATTTRIAGADRYETAVATALAKAGSVASPAADLTGFVPATNTVYVASGEVYADALAAGPLAAAAGNVLLLVEQNKIPAAVTAALGTAVDYKIVVLGGTGTISSGVYEKLAAFATGAGASITRTGGADRYETAALLAGTTINTKVVLLASGENFADALAAGPLAAKHSAPILLTKAGELPATTAKALTELAIDAGDTTFVVGGTGSVSTAVVNELRLATNQAAADVIRISGADRYETSAAVVTTTTHGLGLGGTVYIASGAVFADALAGNALVGTVTSDPILLVEQNSINIKVSAALNTATSIVVLGGTGSVSDAVKTAAASAADNTAPVITLPAASTNAVKVGAAFNPLTGVTAADTKDGDITSKVVVKSVWKAVSTDSPAWTTVVTNYTVVSSVSTAATAVYRITYTVTDSQGLSHEVTRDVSVYAAPTLNALAPSTGTIASSSSATDTDRVTSAVAVKANVTGKSGLGTLAISDQETNVTAAVTSATIGGVDALARFSVGADGKIAVTQAGTGVVPAIADAAVAAVTVTYTYTNAAGTAATVTQAFAVTITDGDDSDAG